MVLLEAQALAWQHDKCEKEAPFKTQAFFFLTQGSAELEALEQHEFKTGYEDRPRLLRMAACATHVVRT